MPSGRPWSSRLRSASTAAWFGSRRALPVALSGNFAVERAIEHRVATDAGDDAPHEPQREVKRVGGGS